jgi:hypothetical protein
VVVLVLEVPSDVEPPELLPELVESSVVELPAVALADVMLEVESPPVSSPQAAVMSRQHAKTR